MQHKIHDEAGLITRQETRARQRIFDHIRFAHAAGVFGDQLTEHLENFDRKVTNRTALNKAFALLTLAQKQRVREGIENPAVQWMTNDPETGELRDEWSEADLDVLRRLETGHEVGPVDQVRHKISSDG